MVTYTQFLQRYIISILVAISLVFDRLYRYDEVRKYEGAVILDRKKNFKRAMYVWEKDAEYQKKQDYFKSNGFVDDLAIGDVIRFMTEKCLNDEQIFDELYEEYLRSLEERLDHIPLNYRDYNNYQLVIYDREINVKVGNLIQLTIKGAKDRFPRDIWAHVVGNKIAKDRESNNLIHFDVDCIKTQLILAERED